MRVALASKLPVQETSAHVAISSRYQQLTEAFKLVRIEDKCTSKTDDSGAFACHKLKEFATRGVKRQLTTQLGFITGIPIREQRTSLIVDILQDQISGRQLSVFLIEPVQTPDDLATSAAR
jgi:hypothetical protein